MAGAGGAAHLRTIVAVLEKVAYVNKVLEGPVLLADLAENPVGVLSITSSFRALKQRTPGTTTGSRFSYSSSDQENGL